MSPYTELDAPVEHSLTEKNSEFLTFLQPVSAVPDFRSQLQNISSGSAEISEIPASAEGKSSLPGSFLLPSNFQTGNCPHSMDNKPH